eukprot:SAG31_NODE_17444_length_670_cov_1.045534_1_plen_164_part_01
MLHWPAAVEPKHGSVNSVIAPVDCCWRSNTEGQNVSSGQLWLTVPAAAAAPALECINAAASGQSVAVHSLRSEMCRYELRGHRVSETVTRALLQTAASSSSSHAAIAAAAIAEAAAEAKQPTPVLPGDRDTNNDLKMQPVSSELHASYKVALEAAMMATPEGSR